VILAWPDQIIDAADAEKIGDEFVLRSVPAKEQRARILRNAIEFLNRCRSADGRGEFTLEIAVRPINEQEIASRRTARTKGHRLQTLAPSRRLRQRMLTEPLIANAGAHLDADARSIRSVAVVAVLIADERERKEIESAKAGICDERRTSI